ncbi:MAG TPA: phosphoserine phosphatase SerB [Gammaproteobacteria bacterium]|nr:phosphoserine phosphatase SerB [Gammaproteobacteria bacterium]
MPTVVLQGPTITPDAATHAAECLRGVLDSRASHVRIHTGQPVQRDTIQRLRDGLRADVNLLPPDFDPGRVRLFITDMDSTLIGIECIDEIADYIGVKAQVAAITEAAMRGELDFEQSLVRRVQLLAGLDASALERVYEERLRLNPGAEALIEGLKARGIKLALVSGGFTFFTERLKKRLGLDYTLANTLEIRQNRLTGRVLGNIVGAKAKADFLASLCKALNIHPAQAIAAGDGANDLLMLEQAGLSVAYHAKPALQAQAATALNHCGLNGVLAFLEN